jgi:hypothetical protein
MWRAPERLLRSRKRTELFNRAEPDSIGFSESPVDGSGLGNAHFGSTDERRRVRRVGIAIADEATGSWRFVYCGPKNPTVGRRIRQSTDKSGSNATAVLGSSYSQQAGVCYIPPAV